jgi:hypothetical protein
MEYKWQVILAESPDDEFPIIWLFGAEESARKRYGRIRLKPGERKTLSRQPIPGWEIVEQKEHPSNREEG